MTEWTATIGQERTSPSVAIGLFNSIGILPTMNPFSFAIPFGLIGPALTVGLTAYFWRSLIQYFWWFIGIGAIASYVLMAMCLTWALSDIGFTGNLPTTPKPILDPLAIRYLSFMLLRLAGSAIVLILIRYILSKT